MLLVYILLVKNGCHSCISLTLIENKVVLLKHIEVLLKQLQRVGLHRNEGQTLRDYAAYIDSNYETNKMTELTNVYEKIIYRGDAEGNAWEKYRDSLGIS